MESKHGRVSGRAEQMRREAGDVLLASEPDDAEEAAELEQENHRQDPPMFDQAASHRTPDAISSKPQAP
jgi:hypothetical protein